MENTIHPKRPWLIALLLLLIGLAMTIGGVWLTALGGSPFYLLAGIALLIDAGLAWRRHSAALWVMALILLATIIWSLSEVGFNFWQLEPRLVMVTVLGILLLLPWVRRKLFPVARAAGLALGIAVVAAVLVMIFAATRPVGVSGTADFTARTQDAHDTSVPDSDWLYYGRTAHGDRFAPLDQINAGNVQNLKLAWSMRTGDTMQPGEDQGGTDAGHEFNFEDTPIKVDNTLYVCTGHSWVEAIDAATGKVNWKFNPNADTKADVYLACRGVSYYKAPEGTVTDCPERIIAPVLDARMMALNAKTGRLCQDFGDHGYVSLTQYLGHVPAGYHFVTSPPMVVNDRVILGGWIFDNRATNEPSGAVRAFNPINGQLIWAWDIGHNPENWTPGPNDELTRGTPNAWGVYTADPKLGLVYLPTGNATPDYYGGERRPFDEKYSSSTVALDINTGAPRWHFQNVHHDLWDFDVPVGPSLVDLPGPDGNPVPALVQTTKRGEFFMLNRETGQPIAPVEEKKVPQGAVPGIIPRRPKPSRWACLLWRQRI
ncbi:PQQ-binding-like beta-propeller repeat protein [Sodalis ligni]|uniref:outer membrane protein assembly factor BamB family protein n=1 Tax=Sodalis ligni TaxID=2697027 RepID=UPI001BDEF175|nr:PQQ-binding-like beta-propeller repeat protein [Sodalis ligni]QWA13171.1 PQQ-binding-like beta-propeller repeat protein [Sodalis ligni]